jgi:hypothetical protein
MPGDTALIFTGAILLIDKDCDLTDFAIEELE